MTDKDTLPEWNAIKIDQLEQRVGRLETKHCANCEALTAQIGWVVDARNDVVIKLQWLRDEIDKMLAMDA